MHTEMWQHPATQENVATLRRRGAVVLPPAVGRLTGPDSGPGGLPEPADIAALATVVLKHGAAALAHDLAGRRVVISAGGTREPLDPVRYLGNRSSGKQGWALARVAAARGADVVLAGGERRPARAFRGAGSSRSGRPRSCGRRWSRGPGRRRRRDGRRGGRLPPRVAAAVGAEQGPAGEPSAVPLVRNPDVLAELVTKRAPGQLVVGFAAETGDDEADVLTHARAKLTRKGCDLLVVNDVWAVRSSAAPTTR